LFAAYPVPANQGEARVKVLVETATTKAVSPVVWL
jgi:hypothetical protein